MCALAAWTSDWCESWRGRDAPRERERCRVTCGWSMCERRLTDAEGEAGMSLRVSLRALGGGGGGGTDPNGRTTPCGGMGGKIGRGSGMCDVAAVSYAERSDIANK